MNIIILGPQGSGKGTQAKLLAEKKSLFHIECGQLLREMALTNERLRDIMQKGELVPDDEMLRYIEKHIIEKNNGNFDNLILDGYPRTLNQYNLLKGYLEAKGKKIDLVLYITLPEEETIKRLSARRLDPKTGIIYNLITNPPSDDIDVSTLIQRDDDTPEVITKRLEVFHSRTEPMISAIKSEGILYEVDGTQKIEEIFEKLEGIVDSNGKDTY